MSGNKNIFVYDQDKTFYGENVYKINTIELVKQNSEHIDN